MRVTGDGGDGTDSEEAASDGFGSALLAVDSADGNDSRKAAAAEAWITIMGEYPLTLNRADNDWSMAMERRMSVFGEFH